ncbi:LPS export ABC transporter permease LptG [Novosphingobium acidiphilum]|uniref:LPS export ABC transporter permease LptG n=1 Tax=Novosphingobium acidiphilum TaxID=505248 RepID=UPI00048E60A1|nr:LPS export ABC transporter permease LptG [Novosphingobium acidiphilum]
MLLEFFPSRTMTGYIAKMFAVRIVAVLFMLVLVLQMLNLLSESGHILAAKGNGQLELLRFVALRLPQLISRFLPYSVLLATIFTLATLNTNSEVISMKAAGMSAHQILAPLFLVAAITSLATFAFNERVTVRATAALKAWQDVEYGHVPPDSDVKTNVWMQDGTNILYARMVTGRGAGMQMHDVNWYRRDPTGMVTEIVHGNDATFANPGWRLTAPVSFDVQSTRKTPLAGARIYGQQVNPAQVIVRKTDADGESLWRLTGSIDEIHAAGFRTGELDGKWWHKLSGPLSALLMPLLGAVAGFGLARSGKMFVRIVIGMALGFAYFVVDNAALAMGNFGAYTPFLAAWSPFLLFLLIGEAVLIRTEE